MLLGFALLVLWKHRENILRLPERNRATHQDRRLSLTSIDRLRLVRTPGIGPVTYRQLIARFGTRRSGAGRRARPRPARRRQGPALFGRERGRTRDRRGRQGSARDIWRSGRACTRALLAELDDAPPLLIAKGNLDLLDQPAVAIVGARNAVGGGLPLRPRPGA